MRCYKTSCFYPFVSAVECHCWNLSPRSAYISLANQSTNINTTRALPFPSLTSIELSNPIPLSMILPSFEPSTLHRSGSRSTSPPRQLRIFQPMRIARHANPAMQDGHVAITVFAVITDHDSTVNTYQTFLYDACFSLPVDIAYVDAAVAVGGAAALARWEVVSAGGREM